MDALTVGHVRCFGTLRETPLAPLTLLVGENSSGKSTFLALIRLAWDITTGMSRPDFNEEPFSLGAYDQIATFRGGRGGRAPSFNIGGSILLPAVESGGNERLPARWVGEFTRVGSQPILTHWRFECSGSRIIIDLDKRGEWSAAEIILPSERKITAPDDFKKLPMNMLLAMPQFIAQQDQVFREEAGPFFHLYSIWRHLTDSAGRPYATAPIRTKPERTYNPMTDVARPEGGHIPMILAKTYFEDKETWTQLKKSLEEFGRQSGLLESLTIRPFGKRESDAFQIQIKIAGPPRNLVDVGYGVSQVLPILVDALRPEGPKTYLLQQPEVHLHPKAQAALGSFLLSLVASGRRQIIVETHSDFLIDRIRIDLRDRYRDLSTDSVLILYFEQRRGQASIRPMRIDRRGNLVDAPKGYRAFFLQEEQRFLGL